MPRIEDQHKQEIKQQIWLKIQQNQGIRTAEIADQLKLDRRRVQNYLAELRDEGKIEQEGWGWLSLEFRGPRLYRFELSPEEVITLYLGARLLVKQHDQRNEPAETALRKLATVLRSDAPIGQEIERAADELAQREEDHEYQSIFRKIAQAYAYRKKLKLVYKPPGSNPFPTVFSVYLIEPSLVGAATYIIGHSSNVDAVREYKLGRIQSAELTDENCTIPPEYQGLEVMRHAWSVIGGEAKIEVVLRFSPKVRERVLETRWHPSQETKDDPEKTGWLRWQVKVPSTLDMLPWIRGWGADCEVVEPEGLRKHLIHTTKQLAETYQLQPPAERRPYQWLYAKTSRDNPDQIHLLLYHLIDVGQVTLVMWNEVFTPSFRSHIAKQLGVTVEESGRFIAFIASLHDLGKASPAYQKKYCPPWLQQKLTEVGFVLDDPHGYSQKTNDKTTSHAYITTWALPQLLVKYCGLEKSFSRKIGQALGGHHGAWPTNSVNFNFDDYACPAWDTARRELIWELRNVLQPPPIPHPPKDDSLNIFLTLFSGLTSVADWLGSRDDDEAFPLVKEVLTTREYAKRSKAQAKRVLSDLGWIGWKPNETTLDFETMFRYLDDKIEIKPRSVQQQIINLTRNLTTPSLTIIEAPTGIGKTEIAFYMADMLLQEHNGRGLYIAMPTQATSNQMFERTQEFLKQRYPQNIVNLQLAHGQAAFDEHVHAISLRTIGDDRKDGRVVAMSWFNERSKRTLLAPFGVGTVDQTLMSVLQTKHFFVRLLGLSHKTVIFDEIHAYDTYMSTLFVQLLQWLRAIGTSVIMLSATLPAETRRKFIYAYTGELPQLDNHYPAITIASPDTLAQIHPLSPPADLTLGIHWLEADKQVEHILSLAEQGGCIAVICNTVGRSQSIFRQLLDARKNEKLDIERDNLILFHARFPPIWRNETEEEAKRLFGKPQKEKSGKLVDYRPKKGPAIIVATQVIEQSLDLDFDAMITDLAPIDLLLQRAGRLHRHKIRNENRHGHSRQLTIIQPELDDQSIPHFGSDEYIYESYVLLRTYRTLRQFIENDCITLPKQTIDLIESVYTVAQPSDNDVNWQNVLREARQKMRRERHESHQKAKKQVVGAPDDEMLLHETNLGLEEDNPAVHQTFQAKTRDIGPTLSLICLHATERENRVLLDPDDTTTAFDLTITPYSDLTKQLLRRRINVQHWALLDHFLAEDAPKDFAPPAWRKNSVLRHSRAVIFQDGRYRFEDEKNVYTLSLDRDYGLELEKQPKKEDQ